MPKIINAYSDSSGGIADSLKSIGESIWGDQAKNEGYRQNALKLQRENRAHDEGSLALQRGDVIEALRQGYRGGMSAPNATGYIRGYYGNTKGADSPEFEGAAVGAGENWQNTPRGRRETLQNERAMEQDRTDASRFTPVYGEDRMGNKTPTGAFNTRTGGYQPFGQLGSPAAPAGGATRPGFQNTGLYDEGDQPIAITPAHMSLINGTDENGAPLLSDQGRNRLAQLYKENPGYAGRLMAVIAGHAAPMSMAAMRSKRNAAFMDDLYSIDPAFDAGVWGMRNKTYQDLATSGRTGQMSQALEQWVHHMSEEMIPRMHELGNVDTIQPFSDKNVLGRAGNFVAAPLTTPLNVARNTYNAASGRPGPGAVGVVQEGVANELASIMRKSGMSEAEVERNLHNFATASSPEDFKSRVAAAMGLVEGAFNSREHNINRVLGPDPRRQPLISPETRAEFEAVRAWARGGPMPPGARMSPPPGGKVQGQMPQGAPQPAAAPSFNDRFNNQMPVRVQTPQEAHGLPPGTHYVTPDGQEFTR